MKIVTNKKIIIKDYPEGAFLCIFIVSIILSIIFNPINYDKNSILTFEQTIFVILSAVLFVFNEAIIGYTAISKIRNKINKFKEKHIKKEVLIKVGISGEETENNYSEFFRTTEEDIFYFQKSISKFKRNSFFLYLCFAIVGLLLIFISILDLQSTSHTFFTDFKLSSIINFLITIFIISQILSIFIWIISAYQAEKQKHNILNYFEIDNISKKMKIYIEEINSKKIDMTINGFK